MERPHITSVCSWRSKVVNTSLDEGNVLLVVLDDVGTCRTGRRRVRVNLAFSPFLRSFLQNLESNTEGSSILF